MEETYEVYTLLRIAEFQILILVAIIQVKQMRLI